MSPVNEKNENTKRTAVTAEVSASICQDYQTGSFTQAEIASKYSLSLQTVNRLIKSAGIKPSKRKYVHKTNKFSERNAQILAKAQAGASTRALATEYGVTHQNVSLILKKGGYAPIAAHRERLAVRSAARTERVAGEKKAKADAKMEKVLALSNLWKSGAAISELRQSCNLKSDNAMQVKIVLLRRKFGLDLFPKRNAFGRSLQDPADKQAKVDALSAAWVRGDTIEKCAEAVGWSEKTVSRVLPHLRKTFGQEKFPYRRQPKAGVTETQATTELPEFTNPQ